MRIVFKFVEKDIVLMIEWLLVLGRCLIVFIFGEEIFVLLVVLREGMDVVNEFVSIIVCIVKVVVFRSVVVCKLS